MYLGMGAKRLGLFINNELITSSDSVQLLDITNDKELKFDVHPNNICSQASKNVCAQTVSENFWMKNQLLDYAMLMFCQILITVH